MKHSEPGAIATMLIKMKKARQWKYNVGGTLTTAECDDSRMGPSFEIVCCGGACGDREEREGVGTSGYASTTVFLVPPVTSLSPGAQRPRWPTRKERPQLFRLRNLTPAMPEFTQSFTVNASLSQGLTQASGNLMAWLKGNKVNPFGLLLFASMQVGV